MNPALSITVLTIAALFNLFGAITNPELFWKVVHAVLVVLSVAAVVFLLLIHRET